jgi:hypothetical protein
VTPAKAQRRQGTRNPKFETNPNDEETQILNKLVLDFGFHFVSDFELRISDFDSVARNLRKLLSLESAKIARSQEIVSPSLRGIDRRLQRTKQT